MKHSKIVLLLFSFVAVAFASCIKENQMNIDPNKSYNLIAFENTGSNVAGASSIYPGYNIDLGTLAPGESGIINVNVGYSGTEAAPEDITVNLALDTALLTTYNTQNGTNYVAPPSDIYVLPTSLVIKKGERMGQAQITITRTNSFNFEESYALPLKITSVSKGNVSSNFGEAVYGFGVRNIYDGVYTVTGTLTDAAAATITGKYPFTAELFTLGPNSIYFDPHPILSGGSQSSYGEFAPVFTIDPATNKITSVVNAYGQPSPSRARSAQLIPTGVNAYDPTTKSFDVSYALYQGGVLRTTFVEHFAYVGPR